MSRKALFLGLAMGIAVLSCQRQCYLSEADFKDAHGRIIPSDLACNSEIVAVPPKGSVPPPTTVDDTKREVRYLSLREAIAIALENGTVGAQSPTTPGLAIDTLTSFAGITATSADAIRVFAIDPALTANNIELSLAKFDTIWTMSAMWSQVQTPLGVTPTTFLQTPGTLLPNVQAQSFNYSTGLEKPLPTGGVAGITFTVNSTYNSPPSVINPAIQPSLQFQFEQPLLQGFGIEINQLRDNHPGSILNPFSLTNTGEGILISRVRSNEQRAQFEATLNYLLLNVEAAYWNLYGAYHVLYSSEEAMRYAYESWRLTKLLFDGGRAAEQDMEQTRVQYESFRAQRLTALGQVLEDERQLRGLLGLKMEDGFRTVPTETPVLTPFNPDWRTALDDALARRPELTIARQDLKFRQFDLIRQRNVLLPDLRLVATDTLHSVGSRIDGGPVPQNAFHELVSDPFDNYTVGLVLNVPLGYRAANEAVRNAQLNLKRSYISLRTEEDKAERYLGFAYRQIFQFQRQIQINQAELRAATNQLARKFDLIRQGRAPAFGADLILAEQSWSTAATNLYTAVVQYNNALATFDFARGAIQQRDSVVIGEGPLPQCAVARAVEHEKERTRAIVLAERASHPSALQAGLSSDASHGPLLPLDPGIPLPVLMQNRPPLPDFPADGVGKTASPPNPELLPSLKALEKGS